MAGPNDSQENLAASIKCFEIAVELQKSLSGDIRHKTLFNLGIAFRRAHNPEESCKVFQEAAKLNVAKAATQNNWGLSLFDKSEWDGAKERFEQAILAEEASMLDKSDCSDIAFYENNLGLCYYHLARSCEEDNNIMGQANYHFSKAI